MMNTIVKNVALSGMLLLAAATANAREHANDKRTIDRNSFKTEAGDCTTPAAQFDLDINNVRARMLTGGDLWWNLSEARYEVPKGDGTGARLNAIFSGSIWISGYDQGGNLKVAAQRYRGTGDDFWPGPLNSQGNIDKATCTKYDRFFNVLGSNIEIAQTAFLNGNATVADIPKDVLAWPAKGNQYLASDVTLLGETFVVNDNLAPFKDFDGDGFYDPLKGDYPYIPCRNGEAEAYGDQMVFWVINDAGNIHTESNGQSIGVQINALGFAFQTTDEVNNMTFYKYEIVNKNSLQLNNTLISQNVDPDLGCFENDYIGCDVANSVGVVYNGTAIDIDCQGISGYGSELPMLGVDFFEGPLADDGVTQLGMSSFMYYNNDNSNDRSDPSSAQQYRNFQEGKWKNGVPVVFGGNGLNGCNSTPVTHVFPGNPSDPTQWSEVNPQCGAQLTPGDRRFVQTSGPFTLKPGVAQYVTVGIVFVRPQGGVGLAPNFNTTILPADQKAQALFNNCFKLVDGPAAPTLKIRELNKQLIINLVNEKGSNNFGELYDEVDPTIALVIPTTPGTNGDSTYTFEGYILYQLANSRVSATELQDATKAKRVAQVDVKNNVTTIINYSRDPVLGLLVPTLMVSDPGNSGITNSFTVTEDLFATGQDKALVNHKTYYFTAIAYAHNDFKPYDPANPTGSQLTPFLQGRRNFKVYTAIPHISDPRNEGTVINSAWGEGVEVKRIEGQGNGSNILDLTPETIEGIITSGAYAFKDTLTYVKGRDPLGFKVIDPVELVEADFELQFTQPNDTVIGNTTSWFLRDLTNGDTIFSERTLDRPYEQQIFSDARDYGFSIKLGTPTPRYFLPGNYLATSSSPVRYTYDDLPSTVEYQNPTERWLSFVKDAGQNAVTNWIRSGQTLIDPAGQSANARATAEVFDDNWYYTTATPPPTPYTGDIYEPGSTPSGNVLFHDGNNVYDNIAEGTWGPYCLTNNYSKKTLTTQEADAGKPPFIHHPGFKWRNYNGTTVPPQNTLDRLQSVDIVITPDKSKWSRCIVFETGEDNALTDGAEYSPNLQSGRKGQLRMQRSKRWHDPVAMDYLEDDPFDIGRSYFPGYAVNVETGERLNICFGEATDMPDQNGRDMFWNPTDKLLSPVTFPNQVIEQLPYFGGKHFIYVMETKYDEGDSARQLLTDNYANLSGALVNINAALQPLYRSLMWTSIPYLTPGYQFQPDAAGQRIVPPAEIKVRLRVERPYDRLATVSTGVDSLPRYQFSTKGMGATEKNDSVAKTALDIIRLVPNPYLGYSAYETDQNSNIVKITNLPNKCNITIVSLDGVIIRKLSRSIDVDPATNQRIDVSDGASIDELNPDNSINWDMKNDKGITVGSGIYLFHVEAPGIGQRTLKWFGAIRPADTSNF